MHEQLHHWKELFKRSTMALTTLPGDIAEVTRVQNFGHPCLGALYICMYTVVHNEKEFYTHTHTHTPQDVSSALPEPPMVRERLIQEIRFLAHHLRSKASRYVQ